jgi:hypothetical protein
MTKFCVLGAHKGRYGEFIELKRLRKGTWRHGEIEIEEDCLQKVPFEVDMDTAVLNKRGRKREAAFNLLLLTL